MSPKSSPPLRVALVSMPWAIFNRPSIQLGSLKSYVERETTCTVDNYHPYLLTARVTGTDTYNEIGLSGWGGEALFAPLLFPEKREDARNLFRESLKGKIAPLPDFDHLVAGIEQSFMRWLTEIDLQQYSLIGFSVCFSQLFPSLYLAKQIKKQFADIPLVFGGSSCSGPLGESLIHNFPEIDYLIDGEGEGSLVDLCHFLEGRSRTLPKRIAAQQPTPHADVPLTKLDVNNLPIPDYSPYFKEIQQIIPTLPFIPVLPVEFSRGCWWNKCTFCNLNLQWQNYRFKQGNRMVEETLHLAKSHESLHFTFTDNALPPKEADQFFNALSENHCDFDFFAEIRGITDPEMLQRYNQGGLRTVQVGIEALSSSLLKKMAKGSTVIDNIAVMKMCSGCSIQLEGNLITDFPATTQQEIAETLTNLDFVLPFAPLQGATFFLGYGSPIYDQPGDFSIQAILPHPKNRKLFPEMHLKSLKMLINSYRGDRQLQHNLWQPVKQRISKWQDFHRKRTDKQQHPLHYRDGSTFLIIRQELQSGSPLLHRLRGLSRNIYLFCESPVKIEDILTAFPRVTEKALTKFLDEMCSKRLMFQENDRALSLAIHHK